MEIYIAWLIGVCTGTLIIYSVLSMRSKIELRNGYQPDGRIKLNLNPPRGGTARSPRI